MPNDLFRKGLDEMDAKFSQYLSHEDRNIRNMAIVALGYITIMRAGLTMTPVDSSDVNPSRSRSTS